jgi:hypothetical protein
VISFQGETKAYHGFPNGSALIPLLLLALTRSLFLLNPRGLSTYSSSQSNLEVFLSLLTVSTTVTTTTGSIAKCFTVTNVLMFLIHMAPIHIIDTKYLLKDLYDNSAEH